MDILGITPKTEDNAKDALLRNTDPVLQTKTGKNFRRVQLVYSEITSPLPLPDIEKILTAPMPAISQEKAEDNIDTLQFPALSVPYEEAIAVKTALALEQTMPILMLEMEQSFDIEDRDALSLETVSLGIVKKKRIRKRIGRFFGGIVLLIANSLLLCSLIFIIAIISDPLYKIAFVLVFLITFSYVCSIQAKHIQRQKKKPYISSTQLTHMHRKKSAAPKDKDTEHINLIKQDTTSYLRALKRKDLKRGFLE